MAEGMSNFVDIVGKMAEQQREMFAGAFDLGEDMRDAIVQTDAMPARLARNDQDLVEALKARDEAAIEREKLGLTAPFDLQRAPLEAETNLLNARRDLIASQYGLEAAPVLGRQGLVDAQRGLNDSERLLLESQRNRENEERYSVIAKELDRFMFDNGYGSGGRYDPKVFENLPMATMVEIVERAKRADLSSPAFNELVLQFDIVSQNVFDRLGERTVRTLADASPSQRASALSSAGLTERDFQAIVESVSRRSGLDLVVNTTDPIAATTPATTPVTDTAQAPATGVVEQAPAPEQTASTTEPAAETTPAPTTPAPEVPKAVTNKPMYQPDSNKTKVSVVLNQNGNMEAVLPNGNRAPFNANTQVAEPGKLMLAPDVRKLVLTAPPEAETAYTDPDPAAITASLAWADQLEVAAKSAQWRFGEGVFNGAFEDENTARKLASAIAVKERFRKVAAEKGAVASHSEFVENIDRIKTEFAQKHPVRGWLMKFQAMPSVDDMLRDPVMRTTIENMVDSRSGERLVSKGDIDRHLAGVEQLSSWTLERINSEVQIAKIDPSKFYNSLWQGLNK